MIGGVVLTVIHWRGRGAFLAVQVNEDWSLAKTVSGDPAPGTAPNIQPEAPKRDPFSGEAVKGPSGPWAANVHAVATGGPGLALVRSPSLQIKSGRYYA
jgi:hypothetical protein